MYDKEALEVMSTLLNKPIDEILETYQENILFEAHPDNRKIGRVFKEYKHSDIKLKDIITVEDAEYINVGKNVVGIITDIFKVSRMDIPKPKKKETKKELGKTKNEGQKSWRETNLKTYKS